MPNFFKINYGVGRIHSGMIAYLVELWNEGNKSPFEIFLFQLGIQNFKEEDKLKAVLEYKNIDLALLNEKNEILLIIEMKIDDWEKKKKTKPDIIDWQTNVYYNNIKKSGNGLN